ncbi:hypothetical protein BKI52_11580 [marine bacterium AO1-C]|nr:hypothetical protein BKI52_11580 [marine bacterium AO1-C]
MKTLYYLKPQPNEQLLTQSLHNNHTVSTFAINLLAQKPKLKKIVDKHLGNKTEPLEDFIDYSGMQNTELGKSFYYLANYVSLNQAWYGQIYPDQYQSPLAQKAQGKVFALRPWLLPWQLLPIYIKDYVFHYRGTLREHYPFPFKFITEVLIDDSHEYKQQLLEKIGQWYDGLDITEKQQFIYTTAIAGTAHVSPGKYQLHAFRQEYLMNVLQLNSSDPDVRKYYQQALKQQLGLLSGPSEVAHKIVNLVREVYPDDFELEDYFKYMITALCLASLGYPYNHHSFYEIITVVFPNRPELHSLDNFQENIAHII